MTHTDAPPTRPGLLRVAWSENPTVQAAVDLLAGAGLLLACGPFGLRAVSPVSDTVEELVGEMVRAGFRARVSGPASPNVGEAVRGGRRPGRHLRRVR